MEAIPNFPEARRKLLKVRAADGAPLVLAQLAEEFSVSVDTIRRDLLALEAEGAVRRVRGGALPVLRPSAPVSERLTTADRIAERLATAAVSEIEDGMVLILDGGTAVTHLAQALPPLPRSLIVTPSPHIALKAQASGAEIFLIGGRLSAFGGISVGSNAIQALSNIAADLCFLGACGLDAEFGLSADDQDEAEVKRRMRASSQKAIVLTGASKIARRARHRVLPVSALDLLVTDASPEATSAFEDAGLETRHA